MSLVPHRSISQINKYTNCARKYRFSYIDKIPEDGSIHFPIGSCIDEALSSVINHYDFEPLFERLLKSRSESSLDSVDLAFIEKELVDNDLKLSGLIKGALEKYLNQDVLPFSEEEAAKFSEEDIEYFRACQYHFSRLFKPYLLLLIDKGLMPIESQHKIDYSIEGIDAPMTGFIDMIANDCYSNRIVIVDFKTTKKKLRDASLEHKRQVWAYAKAIAKEYNLSYLPKCEVHYISKTPPALPRAKKKDNHVNGVAFDPEALKNEQIHNYPEELLDALYSDKEPESMVNCFDAYFDRAEWDNLCEVLFDMEHSFAHNFWPRNRNYTYCSPNGCSYWGICVGAAESKDSLQKRKEVHLRTKKVHSDTTEFVADDVKPLQQEGRKPKPPPMLPAKPVAKSFNNFLIN